MERLTERFSSGDAAVRGCGNNCEHDFRYCKDQYGDCPTMIELYERLAEYEEAEEQGYLIRLPYKVGEEVWTVCSNVTYGEIGDPPEVHYYVDSKIFTLSLYTFARDNIFPSKEDADNRKREMENG